MHSCCTDVFLLVVRVYSHTMTSMHLHGSSHEPHCLRFAQKHSHLILVARCRTPFRTWHHARALLPHLFLNQSSGNLSDPAKINGRSRPWRNYHLLQVMSPTGLLKTRITGTSLETVSSLNTRFYVSDPCPSSSRSQRQPNTQWKASRRHRNRTQMMSNFVLCLLHHCACRSEKQVQNDRKFITLNEKPWCPVHLNIR